MSLTDALIELQRRLPEVVASLSRDERTELRRSLAAWVHGTVDDPQALLSAALRHQPDDSPVWDALAQSSVRRDGTQQLDRPEIAAIMLRTALEVAEPERLRGSRLSVEAAAEERVFLAPMVAVPSRDPIDTAVLVLERRGGFVAPAFQFAQHGDLVEGVADVNDNLDAYNDPWGAASWWLCPHAGLHAIPADLIRHGAQDDVVAASRAIAQVS